MNKSLFIVLMGENMLNKIVVFTFVGVISVTSMAALAASNETAYNSTKSLVIVNSAPGKSVETHAAKIENSENQSNISQNSGSGDTTLPATGWLLGMALLGFVMLSNRSGV